MPAATPPPTAAAALASPLSALSAAWLELRCSGACMHIVVAPIKLLAQQHGQRVTVGAVIARLRCSRCGQRPASVVLLSDARHGAFPGGTVGGRESWAVQLVP